jgi:hypothetical protein
MEGPGQDGEMLAKVLMGGLRSRVIVRVQPLTAYRWSGEGIAIASSKASKFTISSPFGSGDAKEP